MDLSCRGEPDTIYVLRNEGPAEPGQSLQGRWRFRDLLMETSEPLSLMRIGFGVTAFQIEAEAISAAATLPELRITFAAGRIGALGAEAELSLIAAGRREGGTGGTLIAPALRFPASRSASNPT